MIDLKKIKGRYSKFPKQIFRIRKHEIMKNLYEKLENFKLFYGRNYNISNKLIIDILGFLIAMNDTFEDIRKESKDYDQNLNRLIYSRRIMYRRMRLNFFNPQEDADEIFNNTIKIVNKYDKGWDSLDVRKLSVVYRFMDDHRMQKKGESSMVLHKHTRLTPLQRKEIYRFHIDDKRRVSDLSREFHVSRPTIYKILHRGRMRDFTVHRSGNHRFRCLKYGIRRLAKVEKAIEEQLKRQAKRYNKLYPGEMIHGDTKRLPLLKGQSTFNKREYMFIAIDDYSRELFAAILPDKTQYSAKTFLDQVLDECAYTIECYYTDNGKEYKGNIFSHAFMMACEKNKIEQRFTKVRRPQTNGKAERVIRTLMEMWHNKIEFKSSAHRKNELKRFINYYNLVKPHKSIDGLTPMEKLITYFFPKSVNNA